MRIDIMTLFPDSVSAVLSESIIGRAQQRGLVQIVCHQIRDYTKHKQRQVDDYPYGGGRGCVMMAQPLHDCWEHICQEAGKRVHTIYMSPAGKVFTQADAVRLKDNYDHLILVCGHYEGVDERFIEACVDEELSIGDFVLTGGEIPAMAVADAVCRLVPGVLADEECFENESHWNGLLEYPQYTRPEVWNGLRVPEILLSGHHENIRRWRRKQSILRTRLRRPDMYARLTFTDKVDLKILAEVERELEEALAKAEEAAAGEEHAPAEDPARVFGQAPPTAVTQTGGQAPLDETAPCERQEPVEGPASLEPSQTPEGGASPGAPEPLDVSPVCPEEP